MNINSINFLRKPEYFFRPSQILKRIGQSWRANKPEFAETVLPWGLKIRFRPNENIGATIWRAGVFDLCVSETIWRLLDPGEKAIDAGANIGYMTSIMAARVGKLGAVSSFEPHPEIFRELTDNVEFWRKQPNLGEITAYQTALSESNGTACLVTETLFESNRGTASLMQQDSAASAGSLTVETTTLNDLYQPNDVVGLMKIDVEGHELSVLKGGERLIEQHQIRDIVFEEHDEPPTPVTEFLMNHGYSIFYISKEFLGVRTHPLERLPKREIYETPNYVATIDPARAVRRLNGSSWAVLR